MGVLEDLKKQAAEAKRQEEAQRESTEARKASMAKRIQPKIQSLYEYFGELRKHLGVVPPELYEAYEVSGFGKLADLRQGGYKLATDDRPEEVSNFTFHYEFARDGRREVKVTDRNVVSSVREFLWAQNLRFTTRESGPSRPQRIGSRSGTNATVSTKSAMRSRLHRAALPRACPGV